MLAERAEGRTAAAGIRAIGSWVALVRAGREMVDAESEAISAAAAQPEQVAIAELVALIDQRLVSDAEILADIAAIVAEQQAA